MSPKPSRPALPIVALLLLAAATVACRGEREQALRSEAGQVAEAVRKLREAANLEKAPLRKALEATACTADDVCSVKKSCVEAYSLQERSIEAIAAVRHAAAGASTAEPVPSAAATLLSNVVADLERAKALAKDCADAEGNLRRRYSL